MARQTRPLTTLKHTCGNTAQDLGDVTDYLAQVTVGAIKRNVTKVTITCETYGIRYSFTSTPTVDGGTAVGHVLAAGGTLTLDGNKFCTDLNFINKVSGSNAVLQITPEVNI